MRRVLVIGSPGSGKSTLARALAQATGLPVVHLDQMYWRAGWVEATREEWQTQVAAALAAPAWIMDGNYGGSLDLRLQHVDTVVWLDFPTLVCLGRVLRRVAKGWGKDRSDLTPGCPERLDFKFLAYVASFRRKKRPGMLLRLGGFSGTLCHLTETGSVAALLEQVMQKAGK